jgi:hypothetical protein
MFISRLGDDPNPHAFVRGVGGQNPTAVAQGKVIELAILVVKLTPIAGYVASQELHWCLPSILKGSQCARCSYDLTEIEEWYFGLILAHLVVPLWDLLLFTSSSVVSGRHHWAYQLGQSACRRSASTFEFSLGISHNLFHVA